MSVSSLPLGLILLRARCLHACVECLTHNTLAASSLVDVFLLGLARTVLETERRGDFPEF